MPHREGRLQVMAAMGASQAEMGEALTLDGALNSCDAEVIAKGLSDKGAERGAIVRHGNYTLWGFAGGPADMTPAGRALFLNTVHYAMAVGAAPVLERKRAKTRDDLFSYLVTARTRVPGLLRTAMQYLPQELAGRDVDQVEAWLVENRPYLRAEGRRFEVDALARSFGLPNHSRAFLEACLAGLVEPERSQESLAALTRYTGLELGPEPGPWNEWYAANRDYLYFSDVGGYRFLVDAQAKSRKIPFEKLRGWSSETVDYRSDPEWTRLSEDRQKWLAAELSRLRSAGERVRARSLDLALSIALACSQIPEELALGQIWKTLLAASPTALAEALGDPSPVHRLLAAAEAAARGLLSLGQIYDALDEAGDLQARLLKAR